MGAVHHGQDVSPAGLGTDLPTVHFQQIAELSPTAAHNVGEEVGLPGRVESWIAKAKELGYKGP